MYYLLVTDAWAIIGENGLALLSVLPGVFPWLEKTEQMCS